MRSQHQEEGHRHKKARLEQRTGNGDLEIIEIDDEPVPVNVPRPQVLSQSQPDISDHGRPPSPPRRSPLQHPPPGLRDPALAPATADPSVAGPRSSYNVQAALQPCDSGLAPISNTPPPPAVLAGPPQLASAGAPPRPFVLADPMQSQIVTDDSSSVPDASATADASAVPFDQIVADLGTRADALATSVKHAAVYLARNTWTEGERRQQVMQVVAELDHRLTFVETTQRSVDERWGRDEEIAELREQLRQAKEDMAEVRQELKKERAERAHIAAEARALKARLDRCVEAEDVGNVVEAQISRMMPTMRNSVKDMVQQIHDNYVTQQLQQANFFPVQHDQKPMAFPPRDGFAYQPPPQVNESRYQVRFQLTSFTKDLDANQKSGPSWPV
ncbi:hypothetical protein BD310DRAFT_804246 [Dichomitus squalens]|uniref:Uncharacterized protein n=1 Tax=Dichomitus squalens TaxID=114155 RepID=A0A4V2KA06_9APHY|nr:hypothetical protein BD310DRAFT_804246 [Dichomitus squalens]